MGGLAMAKKAKKKAADDLDIKAIGIRATKGWADWLERAAKYDRVTIAAFIDKAVAERARLIEFDEAPPERLP